jgi:hypothetical protein
VGESVLSESKQTSFRVMILSNSSKVFFASSLWFVEGLFLAIEHRIPSSSNHKVEGWKFKTSALADGVISIFKVG